MCSKSILKKKSLRGIYSNIQLQKKCNNRRWLFLFSAEDCVHMRKTRVTHCSDVTHWCVFGSAGVIGVKVINEEKTNTESFLQDVSKTGWTEKLCSLFSAGNMLWTNETTINLNILKTTTWRAWQRIIGFYGFQISDSNWPRRIS